MQKKYGRSPSPENESTNEQSLPQSEINFSAIEVAAHRGMGVSGKWRNTKNVFNLLEGVENQIRTFLFGKDKDNWLNLSKEQQDENREILRSIKAIGSYPENTIASFKAAISENTDVIELDVHNSKDGYPMVIHGDKLKLHSFLMKNDFMIHLDEKSMMNVLYDNNMDVESTKDLDDRIVRQHIKLFTKDELQNFFVMKDYDLLHGVPNIESKSKTEKEAILQSKTNIGLLKSNPERYRIPELMEVLELVKEVNKGRETNNFLKLNIEFKGNGTAFTTLKTLIEFYEKDPNNEKYLPPSILIFLGKIEDKDISILRAIINKDETFGKDEILYHLAQIEQEELMFFQKVYLDLQNKYNSYIKSFSFSFASRSRDCSDFDIDDIISIEAGDSSNAFFSPLQQIPDEIIKDYLAQPFKYNYPIEEHINKRVISKLSSLESKWVVELQSLFKKGKSDDLNKQLEKIDENFDNLRLASFKELVITAIKKLIKIRQDIALKKRYSKENFFDEKEEEKKIIINLKQKDVQIDTNNIFWVFKNTNLLNEILFKDCKSDKDQRKETFRDYTTRIALLNKDDFEGHIKPYKDKLIKKLLCRLSQKFITSLTTVQITTEVLFGKEAVVRGCKSFNTVEGTSEITPYAREILVNLTKSNHSGIDMSLFDLTKSMVNSLKRILDEIQPDFPVLCGTIANWRFSQKDKSTWNALDCAIISRALQDKFNMPLIIKTDEPGVFRYILKLLDDYSRVFQEKNLSGMKLEERETIFVNNSFSEKSKETLLKLESVVITFPYIDIGRSPSPEIDIESILPTTTVNKPLRGGDNEEQSVREQSALSLSPSSRGRFNKQTEEAEDILGSSQINLFNKFC